MGKKWYVLFSIRYGIPNTTTRDPRARRIIGLLRIFNAETN
jgi:hypothetical protein